MLRLANITILQRISSITALNEKINDELLASMKLDSDEDMDTSTNDGDADRQGAEN